MNRRNFLVTAGGAAAALTTRVPFAKAAGVQSKKNVILVYASGGWDPAHVLDPKPGSAVVSMVNGSAQTYGTDLRVWTGADRPNVAAFFQAYGTQAAAVNGINVNSISHQECRQRMLTGTRSETNPDIAAMAAFENGWDRPAPYLVLGPSAFTGELASGATRLGNMNQIVALLDPPAVAAGPYPAPAFTPNAQQEAAIRSWVDARSNRVAEIRGQLGKNQKRVADFMESLGRGDLLRQNKTGFGTIGATLSLAAQRALAVDMLQEGISASVHLDTTDSWDTHDDITDQSKMCDDLYRELKLLADDLAARPGSTAGSKMIDETIVVVCSEMGRTPRLNGRGGKDHWPTTSALVFGAGVRGGRSLGRTSNGLQPQRVDFATGEASNAGRMLETGSFVAGVLKLAGVDPTPFFYDVVPFDAVIA